MYELTATQSTSEGVTKIHININTKPAINYAPILGNCYEINKNDYLNDVVIHNAKALGATTTFTAIAYYVDRSEKSLGTFTVDNTIDKLIIKNVNLCMSEVNVISLYKTR